MREGRRRAAHLVQALAKRGRYGEIERRKIILQLRKPRCSENDGGYSWLSRHPVQRDLSHAAAKIAGDFFQLRHDSPVVLAEFLGTWMGGVAEAVEPAGIACLRRAVFATWQSACQRAPDHDAGAMACPERHEFMLDGTLRQGVFKPQRRDRLIAAQFRDRLRPP